MCEMCQCIPSSYWCGQEQQLLVTFLHRRAACSLTHHLLTWGPGNVLHRKWTSPCCGVHTYNYDILPPSLSPSLPPSLPPSLHHSLPSHSHTIMCIDCAVYNVFPKLTPGLDKIEHLQSHPQEEVYAVASRIIDKFFRAEEEEDEEFQTDPDPMFHPQLPPGQQSVFSSNSTQHWNLNYNFFSSSLSPSRCLQLINLILIVYLFVCLFICLFVCLFVCLFAVLLISRSPMML